MIRRFSIMAIPACFLFVGCAGGAANADSTPCSGEVIKNRGLSIEQIVASSTSIQLAYVEEYVVDGKNIPYTGYYRISPISELKGSSKASGVIWGLEPYAEVPQQYMDITEVHATIDPESVYGGHTAIVDYDGVCVLAPRFKLGWLYLIISGVQSEMAFEPINSPQLDAWYKQVESAASLE